MGLSSPTLKHVKVTLAGSWGSERHSDWRGLATAEEPIVAVAFLTQESEVCWCKSERTGGPSTPVRLALFWYDEVGKDVQVNFSAGEGGRRLQTLLPSTGYRPAIEGGPYLTGHVQLFARIAGEPRVECQLLFLAAEQVRVVRSGLWRVKEKVAEGLEPPLRNILTRGRTGRRQGGITAGLIGSGYAGRSA
jgi:hypothetical protein